MVIAEFLGDDFFLAAGGSPVDRYRSEVEAQLNNKCKNKC